MALAAGQPPCMTGGQAAQRSWPGRLHHTHDSRALLWVLSRRLQVVGDICFLAVRLGSRQSCGVLWVFKKNFFFNYSNKQKEQNLNLVVPKHL